MTNTYKISLRNSGGEVDSITITAPLGDASAIISKAVADLATNAQIDSGDIINVEAVADANNG